MSMCQLRDHAAFQVISFLFFIGSMTAIKQALTLFSFLSSCGILYMSLILRSYLPHLFLENEVEYAT
ncbi:MAG: hypothetical protein NVSMB27_50220 [Ktedonobacteraceae bacterium]